MKDCKYKKDVGCYQLQDTVCYSFPKNYPDSFKNMADFLEHIKERDKKGCEVCHFFKAGFKGEATVDYIDPLCLAC